MIHRRQQLLVSGRFHSGLVPVDPDAEGLVRTGSQWTASSLDTVGPSPRVVQRERFSPSSPKQKRNQTAPKTIIHFGWMGLTEISHRIADHFLFLLFEASSMQDESQICTYRHFGYRQFG